MSERENKLTEQYKAAAHGMQTGVMYELEKDPSCGTPKHLRTGLNSAMVETSALADLLMSKGIFTKEEYLASLASGMEYERKRYENMLSVQYGINIKLG